MERGGRDLYFEPGRRRFWEGLGEASRKRLASVIRGLDRCALDLTVPSAL